MANIVNLGQPLIKEVQRVEYLPLSGKKYSLTPIKTNTANLTSVSTEYLSIGDSGGWISYLQIDIGKSLSGSTIYYGIDVEIKLTIDDIIYTVNIPRIAGTQGSGGTYRLILRIMEGSIDKKKNLAISEVTASDAMSSLSFADGIFTKEDTVLLGDFGTGKTTTIADDTTATDFLNVYKDNYSLTPYIFFNKNLKVSAKGFYGNCSPTIKIHFVGGAKIA